MEDVRCAWCGKHFKKKKSSIKNNNYCCRKCLGKANGARLRKDRYKICDYCGKAFHYNGKHKNRNKHFYCSKDCAWNAKMKKLTVICDLCGVEFQKKSSDVSRSNHNFCCKLCNRTYRILMSSCTKDRMYHGKALYRIQVEMSIGRPLENGEHVHHVDGNHQNNNPDNLMVVSKSMHGKIHAAGKERDEHGRFIAKK